MRMETPPDINRRCHDSGPSLSVFPYILPYLHDAIPGQTFAIALDGHYCLAWRLEGNPTFGIS